MNRTSLALERADRSLLHNHPHSEDYEILVISSLCFARAFETETVWIMCNPGGDAMEGFMGASGAWAPLQGKLGGLNVEIGLELVDVDLNVLKVSYVSSPRTFRIWFSTITITPLRTRE